MNEGVGTALEVGKNLYIQGQESHLGVPANAEVIRRIMPFLTTQASRVRLVHLEKKGTNLDQTQIKSDLLTKEIQILKQEGASIVGLCNCLEGVSYVTVIGQRLREIKVSSGVGDRSIACLQSFAVDVPVKGVVALNLGGFPCLSSFIMNDKLVAKDLRHGLPLVLLLIAHFQAGAIAGGPLFDAAKDVLTVSEGI